MDNGGAQLISPTTGPALCADSLTGKAALVTGSSSGIGLAVAIRLAKAGATVFGADVDDASPLTGAAAAAGVAANVRPLFMDVTSDASVTSAVRTALLSSPSVRLDLVFANAGFGCLLAPESASIDEWKRCFDVNLFGVLRVLHAVLPKMRDDRAGGRILVTSSDAGVIAYPQWPVYSSSKFALEGAIEAFAPLYAPLGIHMSLVEPGPVATQFMKHALTGVEVMQGLEEDLGAAENSRKAWNAEHTHEAEEVAEVFFQAAVDAKPKLRYATGKVVAERFKIKSADVDGSAVMKLQAAYLRGGDINA